MISYKPTAHTLGVILPGPITGAHFWNSQDYAEGSGAGGTSVREKRDGLPTQWHPKRCLCEKCGGKHLFGYWNLGTPVFPPADAQYYQEVGVVWTYQADDLRKMIKDVTVLYSDEYIHGTFHASYMVTPENYQAVTFDWDFIIVPGGATSGEPLSPEEFFRRMKLHYYPSVTKQNVSFVESGTTRLATINMYCKDQNFYDAIYTDVENRRYDIIYNEIEKRRIARES